MDGYLTTKQAAEKLGTSQQIVQRLIKQGRLPAIRLGRDWLIEEKHLRLVRDRPTGRPIRRG